ncbi:unnamed protein product [Sphagnum jensenii]|uniref:Uncharacterized protein n=1 Tax=Sphagnum jensenii TaxID=128206 RepID=A0ABP1BMR0_9BRYO
MELQVIEAAVEPQRLGSELPNREVGIADIESHMILRTCTLSFYRTSSNPCALFYKKEEPQEFCVQNQLEEASAADIGVITVL